jgi:hypothetical protein
MARKHLCVLRFFGVIPANDGLTMLRQEAQTDLMRESGLGREQVGSVYESRGFRTWPAGGVLSPECTQGCSGTVQIPSS